MIVNHWLRNRVLLFDRLKIFYEKVAVQHNDSFFYIVTVFALERQQRGDGNDEEKEKVNDINDDTILGR